MLKSTGSEFAGFPRDRYTTLVETDDRIMATSVTGRWRFLPEAVEAGIDYNGLYAEVSAVLLSTFATVHSLALQQTLFAMGKAAIEARPEIAEVRFAMPNKHHFLVDLAPFGLENPNEVFYAADRPYGLIEAAVVRDGAAPRPTPGTAWPASADPPRSLPPSALLLPVLHIRNVGTSRPPAARHDPDTPPSAVLPSVSACRSTPTPLALLLPRGPPPGTPTTPAPAPESVRVVARLVPCPTSSANSPGSVTSLEWRRCARAGFPERGCVP